MLLKTSRIALSLFVMLLLVGANLEAYAVVNSIRLTATNHVILADGKHTTTIRAEVRDTSGRPVTDNTIVQFQTTAGNLSQSQAETRGGIATVTLTSAPLPGIAKITAFATGVATLEVLFTDDPQETFDGNLYLNFTAGNYLAYIATEKVIEAIGKNNDAKVTYRHVEITADRLQYRCQDGIVKARDNVVLKRGTAVLKASRLYYNIQTAEGFAIAELDGRPQPVSVHGESLRLEPRKDPLPTSYFHQDELSVKLVIVARNITYFPNDKLQFRRPRFFQDQTQILSLPYYQLGLYETELFSDQFISFGTSGFGLELPFYYDLTPRSSGIVYLRHQQQLGRGYYSTQRGWAIDVIQGYTSTGSQRYEGAYGFIGLTRSDWGFRWTHNQEFNDRTQGGVYFELPRPDSLFSTVNFSQQARYIRWGLNFSGGQTFNSERATSTRGDVFIESQPRRLFGSKSYSYTIGTSYSNAQARSRDTSLLNYNQTTQNIGVRAFSRPVNINKRTTLTNSFSFGQLFSQGAGSGFTALSTLSLDHVLSGGGALNLSYDFVTRPSSIFTSNGKHRFSVNYGIPISKGLQISLFGSSYVDAPESSLLADMSFRINDRWRLIGAVTLQRFHVETFNDLQFVVGYRIGARELQLAYSTFNRRFAFDLTATRF